MSCENPLFTLEQKLLGKHDDDVYELILTTSPDYPYHSRIILERHSAQLDTRVDSIHNKILSTYLVLVYHVGPFSYIEQVIDSSLCSMN